MPTTLPRHTITETPDVKTWLDDAARLWVDDAGDRPALIKRLLESGHRGVTASLDDATQRRRQAIKAASGSMTGLWPAGWYADYKRDEWT